MNAVEIKGKMKAQFKGDDGVWVDIGPVTLNCSREEAEEIVGYSTSQASFIQIYATPEFDFAKLEQLIMKHDEREKKEKSSRGSEDANEG